MKLYFPKLWKYAPDVRTHLRYGPGVVDVPDAHGLRALEVGAAEMPPEEEKRETKPAKADALETKPARKPARKRGRPDKDG